MCPRHLGGAWTTLPTVDSYSWPLPETWNLKWERDLTEIEPEIFMNNSLNFIYT